MRTIDEKTVSAYYKWLGKSKLADRTQAKRWRFFVRFVTWLGSERTIESLPRNLNSPEYEFRVHPKKIKTYDDNLVKDELAKLTPRLKLYAMLGLNCGCTQVDFAALTIDQYRNGTITRKRVKTSDHDDVPTVTYKLWPETIRLLEE